jgi:hypothetical protein
LPRAERGRSGRYLRDCRHSDRLETSAIAVGAGHSTPGDARGVITRCVGAERARQASRRAAPPISRPTPCKCRWQSIRRTFRPDRHRKAYCSCRLGHFDRICFRKNIASNIARPRRLGHDLDDRNTMCRGQSIVLRKKSIKVTIFEWATQYIALILVAPDIPRFRPERSGLRRMSQRMRRVALRRVTFLPSRRRLVGPSDSSTS